MPTTGWMRVVKRDMEERGAMWKRWCSAICKRCDHAWTIYWTFEKHADIIVPIGGDNHGDRIAESVYYFQIGCSHNSLILGLLHKKFPKNKWMQPWINTRFFSCWCYRSRYLHSDIPPASGTFDGRRMFLQREHTIRPINMRNSPSHRDWGGLFQMSYRWLCPPPHSIPSSHCSKIQSSLNITTVFRVAYLIGKCNWIDRATTFERSF